MALNDVQDEVVLPRRVVPQPTPGLYQFGDCGACVLAGLTNLSVAGVYATLCGGNVTSITRQQMQHILQARVCGGSGRMFDRVVENSPLAWPILAPEWQSFGMTSYHQSYDWFRYVRLGLEAGYYAIAAVDHDKKGIAESSGVDHWVLLCGARTHCTRTTEHGAAWEDEVLVSCSSRATPDEEWVSAYKFLKWRGGFNVMLVRPRS